MTEEKKVNYWTMKDEKLVELAIKRGIEGATLDRKGLCWALKEYDVKHGKFDEIVEETDEGLVSSPDLQTVPTTRVKFHNTNPETDMPYIPVGHNGRMWYLPKEIELDLPDFILDSCIKDAVEDRLISEVDRLGNINWITKPVHRFPYSVIPKT